MNEAAPGPTRAPKHLWIVGAISLLWNGVGAVDFTLTQLHVEAYLKQFTPVQRDYFLGFPLWVVLSWGVGVYASLAGSVALLLRRTVAVPLFAASLVGIVLTTVHNYGLSNGHEVMGGGVGTAIFSASIFVIGFLLWLYARAMRRRGVLR